MFKMTASKAAKAAGFTSLKQVQEIGGESQQTLGNWYKNQWLRFDIHLLGCAVKIGLITTYNNFGGIMENEYLLELNFDDGISPVWVEKHHPSSVEEAKSIVQRAIIENHLFSYAELYETKLIELD